MKVYVVTADIELTEKPAWLDDFRSLYDRPFKYHITLKQPCYVKSGDVADIKQRLATTVSSMTLPDHSIIVSFNKLEVSKDAPGGMCIMINAENDQQIREVQRQIVTNLATYSTYYKAVYKTYEENFRPHITIGRDLSEEQYAEAAKQLTGQIRCIGEIKRLMLTVVNNFGPEEANDPANQTVFEL